MLYSMVGILAIVVHLIVNIDVFVLRKDKRYFRGQKYFLFFLLAVIAYHITDGIWGFIYDAKNVLGTHIDTTFYFVAMAVSILLWGIFVHKYIGDKNNKVIRAFLIAEFAVFGAQMVTIIVNLFVPIFFSVSQDCVYKAEVGRYVMLSVQIAVYLLISIYMIVHSLKDTGSARRRHLFVAMFGFLMIIAITLQAIFPFYPMYSLGYLLGICLFHTLVIEDEKANWRHELEEAKAIAMIDTLTGAFSKHAYVDKEAEIDKRINERCMEPFAVVVFDLNDLKTVNDTLGHEAGDNYISESVKLISEHFNNVPVYRVGGDEFVVILEREEYENRHALLDKFNERMDEDLKNNDLIVVSSGISDYDPDRDTTIIQIFTRADREMYKRKACLKNQNE